MASLQTNTAAAITLPAASIKPPLRLHSITKAPRFHPMCSNRQTHPQLGNPSSIIRAATMVRFSTIDALFVVVDVCATSLMHPYIVDHII
jgi:hypothetical protein